MEVRSIYIYKSIQNASCLHFDPILTKYIKCAIEENGDFSVKSYLLRMDLGKRKAYLSCGIKSIHAHLNLCSCLCAIMSRVHVLEQVLRNGGERDCLPVN